MRCAAYIAQKGAGGMNVNLSRVEEILAASKLNELIRRNEEEDRTMRIVLLILAAIGCVAAVAAIAYAVYKFVTPDYLEDFEEDFEDDFDDEDFFTEEPAEA